MKIFCLNVWYIKIYMYLCSIQTQNDMKTLTTEIEINEIETSIEVEFTSIFGEVEIHKITDLETGNALGLELNQYDMARITNECHEFAANEEFVPVENEW